MIFLSTSQINIFDIHLNQFKAFLTLIDEGTYTRAAEKIGIAQSALTQRINYLESQFSVTLIKRSKGRHRLALTPAGVEFYRRCQSLCNLAESFAEEMRIVREGSSGILRISVSASRSQDLVENILAPFHILYPAIDFDVKEDTLPRLEENMQDELTEIAVSNTPLRHPEDFEILHRLKEEVYAVTAKTSTFIPADKESVTLADLSNIPISLSKGSSILFLTTMSQSGYNPHILAKNSSRRMALSWAKKALAVAIIPMDKQTPRDQNLRYLPIDDEHFTTEKIVYKLVNKPLSPISQKFFAFYLEQMQQ